MKTENKPFAPFSALFHQARLQDIKPKYSLFFYCGKYAVREAKNSFETGQFALCLPAGHNILDYQWDVADLRLILYDTGSMSALGIKKISYELLKLGAVMVCTYSEANLPNTVNIYELKKEFADVTRRNQEAIARKYGRSR